MRRARYAPLLVVACLLAYAGTCAQQSPAQRALIAIEAADALYMPARDYANAERDAGRWTEERFRQVEGVAEKVRVGRRVTKKALDEFLALPEGADVSALQAATIALKALNDSLDDLTAGRPR